MKDYSPIKYYKNSKNRLLEVDWSSIAYHQWHGMVSKRSTSKFEIITSDDEIRVWKNLMIGRLIRYIRLFNPKDIVIAVEGNGVIWRKPEYARYYRENIKLSYDKAGYYVKFDNFVYHVTRNPDGTFGSTKLDPTKPLLGASIEYEKLSSTARDAIATVVPEYKGNRKKQKWDFLTPKSEWTKIRDEFAYAIAKIFRAKVIMHPEAEGDDILYVSTRYYANKYDDIVMVTADSDFNQLLDQPNFVIYNNRSDTLTECVDPRRYLELKILSGDDSDNINGIALPGKKQQLGETTAAKLLESVGNAYAAAKKDGWDNQYTRNRKLIDMSCIPLDIHNSIRDSLVETNAKLGEWEEIYRIGMTEKMINEVISMRDIGYYALCTSDEIDKNPNIFKEHLAPKDTSASQSADFSPQPMYTYGVGSAFSSSF